MGLFNKLFSKLKPRKKETVQSFNPENIWFSLPTISNELPPLTNSIQATDLEISLHEDDWRQNEFLNVSALPLIEIECQKIKKIWDNHSKKIDEQFTAFENTLLKVA